MGRSIFTTEQPPKRVISLRDITAEMAPWEKFKFHGRLALKIILGALLSCMLVVGVIGGFQALAALSVPTLLTILLLVLIFK